MRIGSIIPKDVQRRLQNIAMDNQTKKLSSKARRQRVIRTSKQQ